MAIPFVQGDWAFSRTVTLQAAQIGFAMPDGGETGYPMPIMIAPGAGNDPTDFAESFAFIADPTMDVCFTADPPGANILPHLWRSPDLYVDPGDPRLHGIVLVPSYSAVADTTILMWERDDGAVDLQQPEDVFKVADGYDLNMGLEEQAGDLFDDTANDNDGTRNGCTQQDGILGRGQAFDGTQYLEVPHDGSLDVGSTITMTAWLKREADGLLYYSSKNPGHRRLALYYGGRPALRLVVAGGNYDVRTDVGDATPLSSWARVSWVYDGSSLKVYIDADLKKTWVDFAGAVWNNTSNLLVGTQIVPLTAQAFQGTIDEFSVLDVAHSGNRISEDSNWIADNVARLGFGAREAVGGGPIIGSSIIGSSMIGPGIIVPLPHYIRRR